MKDNMTFKVGDKIVRFGQVYRIFRIKKQKRTKDEKETIIFFSPYLKTRKNRTLICSIPVNNIDKTNIRRPISKKGLRQLFKKLSQKSDIKTPFNTTKARGQLSLNDPYENVEILKHLWQEKKNESTSFTKTREDVFRLALKRLMEEVALVKGVSIGEARRQIKAALEKGTKNDKNDET